MFVYQNLSNVVILSLPFCEGDVKSITFPRLDLVFKFKIKVLVPLDGILWEGLLKMGRQRRIELFEITSHNGHNQLPILGLSCFLATNFKLSFVDTASCMSQCKWSVS